MLDVLIIGGGPHALTLASLLASLNPDQDSDRGDDSLISTPTLFNVETFKRTPSKPATSESAVCRPLCVLAVDTYGEWAALWESQFTALNIPHLRSHTLVHTDPLNKNALQEFALKSNRSAELHSLPDHVQILDENAFFNDMRLGKKERRRLNVTSTLKKNLSFCLPGTKLNRDGMEKQKVRYFHVELQDGRILKARQVVLATGPTRAQMSNIPEWVKDIGESYPEGRLQHTVHLMHKLPDSEQKPPEADCQDQTETSSGQVCEAGQRVMVVGGGLTSAHVVSIALQQGASHVTWVMRKHLQLKQFDVGDVESLVGRYSHVEHGIKMDGQAYLRQFYNERSLHKRLAMVRQARKGGAITPEAYIHLQPFILSGRVELKTFCQVIEASWCYRSQTWGLALSNGDRWMGDRIWLATGCKLDVKQDPLLSEVMKNFPIQVVDGWPCILESLQWTEGCPLYLMGHYTALQVGPHAVNLAGGQAASMRIAKDILHRQMQHRKQDSEMGRGKSRIEEYIQQMQGLFWL
uniref:Zgc:113276 n=1 Tax=Fundulus heteroclitus TaxID=8078 RepID=A0A3Q2QHY6_FUNHE